MVTVKTPPVTGTRATSPRSVPKVERSSCPNWSRLELKFVWWSSHMAVYSNWNIAWYYTLIGCAIFNRQPIWDCSPRKWLSWGHSHWMQINKKKFQGVREDNMQDGLTYAARSIHLHCVQNLIAMRGRCTRSMAVVLAPEPGPNFSDCGVEPCARLVSIGGVGSVMTIWCVEDTVCRPKMMLTGCGCVGAKYFPCIRGQPTKYVLFERIGRYPRSCRVIWNYELTWSGWGGEMKFDVRRLWWDRMKWCQRPPDSVGSSKFTAGSR